MKLTPMEFLQALKEGKKESDLNKKEDFTIDIDKFNELINKYDHTKESAIEYLEKDYSNGFTICGLCGSFYQLGNGFLKHISEGCLHCEGEEKHRVYHVKQSKPSEGGFPARYMSVMFDDGMSYCKDKLQIEKFKELI